MSKKYLLDVNMLVALSSDEHEHHQKAHKWFDRLSDEWATCALTEAGYLRLAANPSIRLGPGSAERAIAVLTEIQKLPDHRYWPIEDSWIELTAPFIRRIFGHQQVTDACLLGLAIKENGVLVTLDKAIGYLAGTRFAHNLLVLE